MNADASPGELLRQALAERGWSQGQLAMLSGIRQQHVWLICKNQRRITPWVAARLEIGFRGDDRAYRSAKEWLEVQGAWDLAGEKQEASV